MHAERKKELRKELQQLKQQIMDLIEENSTLPDLEKLERHEFNLDEEERQRLIAVAEEDVKKVFVSSEYLLFILSFLLIVNIAFFYWTQVREEIELENLAKMFLCDVIKKECWDLMAVKGRAVKGFNSILSVTNYPMIERSQEELQELAFVTKQRKIELAEYEAQKEFLKTKDILQGNPRQINYLPNICFGCQCVFPLTHTRT